MRAGIPNYWSLLRDQLHVIGFEPDEPECYRLNALKTEWSQTCYPYALDSVAQTPRHLYLREHNRAADGIYPWTWWSERFGVATPKEARNMRPYRRADYATERERISLDTTTYNAVARAEKLPRPDFMKIDVEGAELDVLKGADDFLDVNGILSIEAEVRFIPIQECPLFIDIYNYLGERGYHLFNLSPFRISRRVLPMPLLWDHRDHNGEPMMIGHTTRGQFAIGDAFFARDLIAEGFVVHRDDRSSQLRVLKAAAMLELYNIPDCAAELLLYYQDPLKELIDVHRYLDQLVPEDSDISRPRNYAAYLELYRKRKGRLVPIDRLATTPLADTETVESAVDDTDPSLVAVNLTGEGSIASGGNAGSPDRAFDSDPETFWVSGERGADVRGNAWIGYAFDWPHRIRGIRLIQTSNRPFRQDWVMVQASRDGGAIWENILAEPADLRHLVVALIEVPEVEPARLWRILAAGENAVDSTDAWTVPEIGFFTLAAEETGQALFFQLDLAHGQAIASDGNAGSPDRAFDGDPETFWVSSERGSDVRGNAWIGYAFDTPQTVRQIRIEQSTNAPFRQDYVRVEKSLGGQTWQQAAIGPFYLAGKTALIDLPEGEPATSWRVIAAGENAVDLEHAWTVITVKFLGEATDPA
jgi:FkbM family methyltransferase